MVFFFNKLKIYILNLYKHIKTLFLLIIICFTASNLFAQSEEDLIRYSFLNQVSTARAKSIGGAVGSIGADFSGISVNPATLARYTKNEFTLTYSAKDFGTNSIYYGSSNNTRNTKGELSNIGIVFASSRNENKNAKWKNTAYAFGVNDLENFSRNYKLIGSSNSSISNYWAALSNANGGYANLQFQNENIGLAFETGFIDTIAGGNTLASIMPAGLDITQ
jgi:hypothetical protein